MSDLKQPAVQQKILPMKKAISKPLVLWRRITQIVFLFVMGQWSFYGIFRCPFLVPYVSCQNCPVITCPGRIFTMFWGFWLLLPLSAIFFGRAFCGWACPGGFASQIFGKLASFKLRIKSTSTNYLSALKYLFLLLALYSYFILGQPREAVPIRIGDFFQSIQLTFEHAQPLWIIKSVIVIGLMLLGLIVANAWCRFFCPTGGILDIFRRISIFRIYTTDTCNDCNKCRQICHMGTRPNEANCTNCGDCISHCPQDAIKIGCPRN